MFGKFSHRVHLRVKSVKKFLGVRIFSSFIRVDLCFVNFKRVRDNRTMIVEVLLSLILPIEILSTFMFMTEDNPILRGSVHNKTYHDRYWDVHILCPLTGNDLKSNIPTNVQTTHRLGVTIRVSGKSSCPGKRSNGFLLKRGQISSFM